MIKVVRVLDHPMMSGVPYSGTIKVYVFGILVYQKLTQVK